MIRIDSNNTSTKDLHQFLLGCVAPRPIAFASTIDEDGNANLAPYSFFNCFSSNPPILVFSSNRRVSDNTTKDTLHNIERTGEVVINVVNYAIVRQMAVTSISFPSEVSEFEKAGLTPIPSEEVKPFRVKESPAQMECKVEEIIPLGEKGGAGHLIICKVLCLHLNEAVVDERNRIDPHKIDLMGRMGRAYYVRASGAAIHTIVQSVLDISIGFDQLPESLKNSTVLTGNNLGQLAGLTELPDEKSILALSERDSRIKEILQQEAVQENLHTYAKELLDTTDDRTLAIKVALLGDYL